MFRFTLVASAFFIAVPAHACNTCGINGAGCHIVAQQSYAVKSYAVQKQAIYPQYYYFVGAPLRAEAVIEHQKQRDPDYQQFQQFKEFLQYKAEVEAQQSQQVEQLPQTVLQARCASCHNAKSPAGGYALDGSTSLDAADKEAVMASVLNESMPKGKEPLTPEELGELVDVLFLK